MKAILLRRPGDPSTLEYVEVRSAIKSRPLNFLYSVAANPRRSRGALWGGLPWSSLAAIRPATRTWQPPCSNPAAPVTCARKSSSQ